MYYIMSLLEKREELLDKCINSLNSCKQLISDYFDEDEKEVELEKLKTVVKEHCRIESDFEKSERALRRVENELNGNENFTSHDVDKLYKDLLTNEPESTVVDYQQNRVWQRIFEGYGDVVEVKKKKGKGKADLHFEDVGDSVLCSSEFSAPIDPISKVVIRDPYKNKLCKHVYEHSTIVGYIKQMKSKAKCPYIGCNSQLRMTDLQRDSELESQITTYLAAHSEDSSDDD